MSKLEDGVAESEEQTGSGSGIGSLRNSLLPDGSLSAKFTTTVGHDLETVTGTVFVGAYPGEEPRILWLRLNENIIPTGSPPATLKCSAYADCFKCIRYGDSPDSYLFCTLPKLFYRKCKVVQTL